VEAPIAGVARRRFAGEIPTPSVLLRSIDHLYTRRGVRCRLGYARQTSQFTIQLLFFTRKTKHGRQKFLHRLQAITHSGAGAAEARFDRTKISTNLIGDFLIAEALDVAHDQHDALIRREMADAGLDGAL